MNAKEATELYYSRWLGSKENLFAKQCTPLMLLYTTERNMVTPGYGCRFDVYALQTENRVFVSYGDAASARIKELEELLKAENSLAEATQSVYGVKPVRSVKYFYDKTPTRNSKSRILTHDDYRAYEGFFQKCNPQAMDISWLKEYFEEMTEEHFCCGVFMDGELVSCTDAPAMPYMADCVQEIGINTRKEYKRRGYAKQACLCAIQEIIRQKKCPLWSTEYGNIASMRLAETLGFKRFGESYAVCLP